MDLAGDIRSASLAKFTPGDWMGLVRATAAHRSRLGLSPTVSADSGAVSNMLSAVSNKREFRFLNVVLDFERVSADHVVGHIGGDGDQRHRVHVGIADADDDSGFNCHIVVALATPRSNLQAAGE